MFFMSILLGNVSSFILLCLINSPIDVDEDEAIEEAIGRSLLEESVQSLQDSRYTCLHF